MLMEQAALRKEIYPASASIAVLQGHFLGHQVDNVVIVYRDRIELFISNPISAEQSLEAHAGMHFMSSMEFSKQIVLATAIHLPKNYLRNHIDSYESELSQNLSAKALDRRSKMISDGEVDAVVLVFGDHRVCVLVYSIHNGGSGENRLGWYEIACYYLDRPENTEHGSESNSSETLSKIITDEKHSCMMILESKRWLHVFPWSVKRVASDSVYVSESSAAMKTESDQQVDSWANILDVDCEEDAREKTDDDLKQSTAEHSSAISPIFFDFAPLPLIIDGTPYSTIDLGSLTPPICSIVDCIPLIGYSDPCLLFLHQRHLTWPGRMKLRAHANETEEPVRGEESREKPLSGDGFNSISVEEGKRMLSATLSIVSFDFKASHTTEQAVSGRVIWSYDGFPYNSTNIFLIHDQLSKGGPQGKSVNNPGEKLRLRFGGGVLVFSRNCVFFLTITGRRVCYATHLNTYGAEELASERSKLIHCPALIAGASQEQKSNLSAISLESCQPVFIHNGKFLLFLRDESTILMEIHFSDVAHQVASVFSFARTIEVSDDIEIQSSFFAPYPSHIAPFRNISTKQKNIIQLLISSTYGDAHLVTYFEDVHQQTKIGSLCKLPISIGLCRVNDMVVLSQHEELSKLSRGLGVNSPLSATATKQADNGYFDTCVRTTFLCVVGGNGPASSHISFVKTAIAPEICARFAFERKDAVYTYVNCIALGHNQHLVSAANENRTDFLLMTKDTVVDVSSREYRTGGENSEYTELSTDPTLFFCDLNYRAATTNSQKVILQITSKGFYFFSYHHTVWRIYAAWEYDSDAEGDALRKGFLLREQAATEEIDSVYFPLVLVTSSGKIMTFTINVHAVNDLRITVSQPKVQRRVLSKFFSGANDNSEEEFTLGAGTIASIDPTVLIAFHDMSAKFLLLKLSHLDGENFFDLEPVKPPLSLEIGLRPLNGSRIIESCAIQQALVVRDKNSRVWAFQLSRIDSGESEKGVSSQMVELPFHACEAPLPTSMCRIPDSDRALHHIVTPQTYKHLGTEFIIVGGSSPIWIVPSKSTGRLFVHSQRQAKTEINLSAACVIPPTGNAQESKNHHILQISEGVFHVVRVPEELSYEASRPLRKVPFNRKEHGLQYANRHSIPLRVINLPEQSTEFPTLSAASHASSHSGFSCQCNGSICVLEKNIEEWDAKQHYARETLDTNPSFHAPLVMTTYSMSLLSIEGYGQTAHCDHIEFSPYETVLDISNVRLQLRSQKSDICFSDAPREFEFRSFLAVGSAFPENEETQCTGCIYLYSVESKNCTGGYLKARNSFAATIGSKFCLVERFDQQGPVTSLTCNSDGLLISTVGSKVMLFTLARRPRFHPTYSGYAGGQHSTCYPYNSSVHELVLRYFFYSQSSFFISSISAFDRYIALTDLGRFTSLYRIDCYPEDKRLENERPAFSNSVTDNRLSKQLDIQGVEDNTKFIVVHIATDKQPHDITSLSFLFSCTEVDKCSSRTVGDLCIALTNSAGEFTIMTYPKRSALDEKEKYDRDNGVRRLEKNWSMSLAGVALQTLRLNIPQYSLQSRSYEPCDSSGVLIATSEGMVAQIALMGIDSSFLASSALSPAGKANKKYPRNIIDVHTVIDSQFCHPPESPNHERSVLGRSMNSLF